MSDLVEVLIYLLFAILLPWGVDRFLRGFRPEPPDEANDAVYPPPRR